MDDELFIGNNCLIDTSKINNKSIFTINKSIPLNPLLADTFYRAGFIEHWGRGIKRICDECKDNDMQYPRFEIISSDFAIIFKANYKYDYLSLDNKEKTNQTNQTNQTKRIKLSKEEQKLIDIISKNPKMSQKELAVALNWTLANVKYYSVRLQQKNVILREGTNRKGRWILI